jgi:hypothetical protein
MPIPLMLRNRLFKYFAKSFVECFSKSICLRVVGPGISPFDAMDSLFKISPTKASLSNALLMAARIFLFASASDLV